MVVIIWSSASWCRKKQHNEENYNSISEGAQAPFSFFCDGPYAMFSLESNGNPFRPTGAAVYFGQLPRMQTHLPSKRFCRAALVCSIVGT
jgi:hypothetical protein